MDISFKPLLTNELSKTKQNIERNTNRNLNDYNAAEHVNDKSMTITGSRIFPRAL